MQWNFSLYFTCYKPLKRNLPCSGKTILKCISISSVLIALSICRIEEGDGQHRSVLAVHGTLTATTGQVKKWCFNDVCRKMASTGSIRYPLFFWGLKRRPHGVFVQQYYRHYSALPELWPAITAAVADIKQFATALIETVARPEAFVLLRFSFLL